MFVAGTMSGSPGPDELGKFCFGFSPCVSFTKFLLQPNPLIAMFWQDPVCGSAHCVLAPYWGGKLGKHKLTAFQVRSCNTSVIPWSIIRLVFEFILMSPGISTEWNTIPGVRSCRQESANSGRSCYCDDWYPPRVAAQWTSAVFSLVVRHDYSAARNKLILISPVERT